MSHIHVYSEIGQLKRIMLSRPGEELNQVHPFHLQEMLMQDTPMLKCAQAEHDEFAQILRDAGADVVYLRDLFTQAMAKPEAREAFTSEFIAASHICSPLLEEAVLAFYNQLDTNAFVDAIYCGIRSDNAFFADDTTLGGMISKGGLFIVEPLPNAYFARDSSINVADGVILSHMCKRYRQREPLLLKYVHRYSDLYADDPTEDLYGMNLPWTIEGGDVMVASAHTLCIGCFGRTEPGAIESVAASVFARGYTAVYAFHSRDPRIMHLDGMLAMIDRDTFMCNPFMKDNVAVFKLTPGTTDESGKPTVRCSLVDGGWSDALCEAVGVNSVRFIPCGNGDMIGGRWESYNLGANLLCIKPGEVAAYNRNLITLDLLDKAGITVHTFCGSELSRGKGGPRCMSMPIWREDL